MKSNLTLRKRDYLKKGGAGRAWEFFQKRERTSSKRRKTWAYRKNKQKGEKSRKDKERTLELNQLVSFTYLPDSYRRICFPSSKQQIKVVKAKVKERRPQPKVQECPIMEP